MDKGHIDTAIKYLQAVSASMLNHRAKSSYNAEFDMILSEIHTYLGAAYGAKGMTDKEIEQIQIALKLSPLYADAHYRLGEAYLKKGLKDRAITEFEMTLSIDPDHIKARKYLNELDK